MLHKHFLRSCVPLPEGLTLDNIFDALEKVRDIFKMIREKAGIDLPKIIQANTFSGLVSNVFTKMLNDVSVYKSFNEQRYPDLMHESKPIGLEVKASNKPMKGGKDIMDIVVGILSFVFR